MTMPADPKADLSTLFDYAMGRLSAEDSLKITQKLEENPDASNDLEFILKLIDFFREQYLDDLEG